MLPYCHSWLQVSIATSCFWNDSRSFRRYYGRFYSGRLFYHKTLQATFSYAGSRILHLLCPLMQTSLRRRLEARFPEQWTSGGVDLQLCGSIRKYKTSLDANYYLGKLSQVASSWAPPWSSRRDIWEYGHRAAPGQTRCTKSRAGTARDQRDMTQTVAPCTSFSSSSWVGQRILIADSCIAARSQTREV